MSFAGSKNWCIISYIPICPEQSSTGVNTLWWNQFTCIIRTVDDALQRGRSGSGLLLVCFTGGHIQSVFTCNILSEKSSLLWCKTWINLSVLYIDGSRELQPKSKTNLDKGSNSSQLIVTKLTNDLNVYINNILRVKLALYIFNEQK